MFTRRTVLKVGLGGAVLLAIGGVGLSLQSTVMRTPRGPLEVLSEREFSILAAIADRVAPRHGGYPSGYDVQVPEKVDALMARMHAGDVTELKQALALIENAAAGLLLEGRTSTFTASKPEEQDAVLDAWRRSDRMVQRKAFKALNGMCQAAYWASPEVWPHVGYVGPGTAGG